MSQGSRLTEFVECKPVMDNTPGVTVQVRFNQMAYQEAIGMAELDVLKYVKEKFEPLLPEGFDIAVKLELLWSKATHDLREDGALIENRGHITKRTYEAGGVIEVLDERASMQEFDAIRKEEQQCPRCAGTSPYAATFCNKHACEAHGHRWIKDIYGDTRCSDCGVIATALISPPF